MGKAAATHSPSAYTGQFNEPVAVIGTGNLCLSADHQTVDYGKRPVLKIGCEFSDQNHHRHGADGSQE